jgi:cellulose synthase/poly-beta-1,6-N-acetylglucosamine synthase-like glycosyltransferase
MRRSLTVAAGVAAAPSAYLLILLAAAGTSRRRAREPRGRPPRFAVVVPAHDEEAGIAATVASVRAAGSVSIVVADNCTDATAERARAAGATVWERRDDARRGKGHALAWAFERVLHESPEVEAIAVVDADCIVSANLLEALGARIGAGARAVQASYMVSNPAESAASAARYAGFALMNHVRPLGRSALGLSSGLLGTGMAFDARLLRDHPWSAFDVTEDTEYHLRLVAAGERVEFAPEAWVASPMPASLEAAEIQRERWESGGFELARAAAPRLVASGLRARDPVRVDAGIELLVPPQSLLMAANGAIAVAALGARARPAARIAAAGLIGQVAFVLGGLALVRAPAPVYWSLVTAPLLAARNARLYSRLARGWRPGAWIRTPRG